MAGFSNSVKFAVAGICSFFKTERNGRIQGVIAVAVILLGIVLRLSLFEWALVLGCIGMVIGLEMVNSAIEKVCNLISTEYNPAIKTIKDICAGAVLLAAIVSAIIGCLVFLPHIRSIFMN